MQRTVNATPERLLADATAFMVDYGATVEVRSETSATFGAHQGMSGGDVLLTGLVGMFNLTAGMQHNTSMLIAGQHSSTLVCVPSEDGESTTVTISDTEKLADNLLRFWLVANVLREPLPNAMMTFKADPYTALVGVDALGLFHRHGVYQLHAKDLLVDLEALGPDKRRITVRSSDGREIKVKASKKEDAERAKAIIEGRIALYNTRRLPFRGF